MGTYRTLKIISNVGFLTQNDMYLDMKSLRNLYKCKKHIRPLK